MKLKKKSIFVSGTDTGVGKTLTSSMLLRVLHQYGTRCAYFKPIQTGEDSDLKTILSQNNLGCDSFSPPVYSFPEPLAPSQAAEIRQKEIQLQTILNHWRSLPDRLWIIEGAGGLLVPLNFTTMMTDLIQALEVRLVLVASTRLGTINHTLLSLEAAQTRKIPILGIVLVGEPNPYLNRILPAISGTRILAEIPRRNPFSNPIFNQEVHHEILYQ